MRDVSDKLMDALEEGAMEGVKALRAYLAYQGDNPMYEKKGKAGAALVTGYTRAFASQTNRAAIRLAAEKSSQLALK